MRFPTLSGFFHLIRFNLSLAVSLSAVVGYVIFSHRFHTPLYFLVLGVWAFASGASAFNQVQERKTDGLMPRTHLRPLASGKMGVRTALLVATLFCLSGGGLLFFNFGFQTAFLGLINLLWYLLLYTPLKKKTPWAFVPGALTGALPVFMGYTAAGGHGLDNAALFFGTLMALWQIPHSWLLLNKYSEEFRIAGLATFKKPIPENTFKYIIISWVAATTLYCSSLPVFIPGGNSILASLFLCLNLSFILTFLYISFPRTQKAKIPNKFMWLNVFLLLQMGMITAYSVSFYPSL